MFKTKNLVHDIKDVPTPWVFEHFCKLKEKLAGEDVKIKSLFKKKFVQFRLTISSLLECLYGFCMT